MRRRDLLAFFGTATAAWPAWAQAPPKQYRPETAGNLANVRLSQAKIASISSPGNFSCWG
jgi:hypothetical protein